jgi:tetratricopeptide (TPR) repeat protein
LTHGVAEQARIITSKLVAQAAFERSKGRILPLSSREELTVLVHIPDDASEIDAALPQPSSAQWRQEGPFPESRATRPVGTPEPFLYAKGVAMRKEGRSREAIELLKLAGKSPSYRLKAQVQIGLCQRSAGDHQAAIQAFRAALNDPSASQAEILDVQYFLARTLELVGQIAEAATLLRRIAQTNPRFKDAAYRVKELSSKLKYSTNGKQRGAGNGSWFSNAIKSFS